MFIFRVLSSILISSKKQNTGENKMTKKKTATETKKAVTAKTKKTPAKKAKSVEKKAPPRKHFLILMRHGKASKDYDLYEDIDRPLNKRGKKDVKIMRKQLAASDVAPDVIICSPARRVTETYEEIYRAFPDVPAFSSKALYLATASDLMELLRQVREDVSNVMLIGHNPGLAELAEIICDGAYSDDEAFRRMGKKFPTSAVAVLEITGNWADVKDNSARLIAFARPVDYK